MHLPERVRHQRSLDREGWKAGRIRAIRRRAAVPSSPTHRLLTQRGRFASSPAMTPTSIRTSPQSVVEVLGLDRLPARLGSPWPSFPRPGVTSPGLPAPINGGGGPTIDLLSQTRPAQPCPLSPRSTLAQPEPRPPRPQPHLAQPFCCKAAGSRWRGANACRRSLTKKGGHCERMRERVRHHPLGSPLPGVADAADRCAVLTSGCVSGAVGPTAWQALEFLCLLKSLP